MRIAVLINVICPGQGSQSPFIAVQALAATLVLIASCVVSRAAERYWVAGDGTWTDGNHWSDTLGGAGGASIPVNGDSAFLSNNGSNDWLATFDNNLLTDPGLTSLRVDATGSGAMTLDLNGGNLFAVNEYIGYDGIGKIVQQGANNTGTKPGPAHMTISDYFRLRGNHDDRPS